MSKPTVYDADDVRYDWVRDALAAYQEMAATVEGIEPEPAEWA